MIEEDMPSLKDIVSRIEQITMVGAEGFEPPPGGLEPPILPSYTIPPVSNSLRISRLGLSASTLSTAQLLLTPLPPLITGFLPST